MRQAFFEVISQMLGLLGFNQLGDHRHIVALFEGNTAGSQVDVHLVHIFFGAALKALEVVFIPGHRYHRAGVILTDFRSGKVSQLTLFDEYQPHNNSDKLMELLDRINSSGTTKVWFAGQGVQSAKVDWKMRREHLSPCRTTKYADILGVKC